MAGGASEQEGSGGGDDTGRHTVLNPCKRFYYVAHSLQITSDRPLPGMRAVEFHQGNLPNVMVRFEMDRTPWADCGGEALWFSSNILDGSGNPALEIWKQNESGAYRITFSHGLTFCVDAALGEIEVRCDEAAAVDDLADFLLGPVLGIVLRLRGITCLHASAVNIEGKAIAFVGDAGAGKSTTAALFAKRDHAILADDIVALFERESSFYALPAYPYLNVWPETLEMLFGKAEAGCKESREEDKLQIPLGDGSPKFQREALPLGAIYLLAERSTESRAPFLQELKPQSALMELIANTYGNEILNAEMRAQEFAVLGQIARSLPIRRVVAGENPALMKRLYELVCEDFAHLTKMRAHGSQRSVQPASA